jgi:hypothetical protein
MKMSRLRDAEEDQGNCLSDESKRLAISGRFNDARHEFNRKHKTSGSIIISLLQRGDVKAQDLNVD